VCSAWVRTAHSHLSSSSAVLCCRHCPIAAPPVSAIPFASSLGKIDEIVNHRDKRCRKDARVCERVDEKEPHVSFLSVVLTCNASAIKAAPWSPHLLPVNLHEHAALVAALHKQRTTQSAPVALLGISSSSSFPLHKSLTLSRPKSCLSAGLARWVEFRLHRRSTKQRCFEQRRPVGER
jgi:hypothetical protein